MPGSEGSRAARILASLGVAVWERGWLSSNNVFVPAGSLAPATVVDTGYVAHAAQTVRLVEAALRPGEALGAIVNTHLHSDHCGGNAALQTRWAAARTVVPENCWDAAAAWDQEALSFLSTDQRCDPFAVDGSLRVGESLALADRLWEVHAAPGHDPTAVMLFEPEARVLISGDALWEERVAIIFPELLEGTGFDAALSTLDAIEHMQPEVVIPGHGRPFCDVVGALAQSRQRLEAYVRDPQRHRAHAARALVMFHMLEARRVRAERLADWVLATPVTGVLAPPGSQADQQAWARELVDGMVTTGALLRVDGWILVDPA